VAPPADRLYSAARALLDTVVAYYDDQGVPLPDRRFVSDGTPAWDCEQVCTYVERTFSGTLEDENTRPMNCLVVRSAQIVVEIARCTPVFANEWSDAPPAADEIDGVAQTVLGDSMLLANGIVAAHKAGDLGGCRGLALVEWESLGPQGGLVGGRQRVRWQLTEV
jgi:hypothetical protein